MRPWLILALISLAPAHALAQCGVERWSVKTGTDADVGLINLNSTTPTTIASLVALPQPTSLPSNNRIQPTETTQFVLNATLTEFKLESDSDYHLVIVDGAGNSMITEIPSPSCVGAGSPLLTGITNARAQMDAMYTVTDTFTQVNEPVTITGIGFFDFLHGQTGVAPNGIEIHPVLNITFGGGGGPGFSMSANPASLSVAQGSSGTSTITTTVAGGFNSAISLAASGMPSGVTATLNPPGIAAPGAGTSTLTLTVTGMASPGAYPITITGSGGGLTHTATVNLTVTNGGPDFTLAVSPPSLTVAPGGSGTATATTTVSGGFNSSISLSASGMPSGVSASFNPSSIAAPGAGTSTLTLTANTLTAPGTYPITVTGTGGGITRTASLSLTISSSGGGGQLITDGGFESATASGLNAPGWTGTTNISGDNVIVAGGPYPHSGNNYASLGGNNNQIDTLTQTLSIPSGAASAPLTFWVSISTQETGTTAYDYLYVEVHNSSGTLLATPLTLTNTNSSSSNNTLGIYFQPAAVDLSAYAGQTIQLVFHATTDYIDTTTFLIDDVSVTSNGGGTPGFTLSMAPSALTLTQGSSGSTTVSSTISGGFNSAIALSASGLPSGTTASFSPSSIAAPGSGSSTMTLDVGTGTPAGTYTLTVTGTGGGLTETASLTLTVSSSTPPGFTLSTSPSSLTINQGSSGTTTVTTTVSGGFNSAIALSASGLPSGTTASFSPSSIAAPGSGSSTMTLSVGASTATGIYTITVQGSGGGITHTAALSLTVSSSGGGGQLIVDGGFESATSSGNSAPGWTASTNISGHTVISYHGAYPHSGFNYADEGSYNSQNDMLIQKLTLPSNISSAILTLWVNVVTQETTTTRKYDYLYVEIHSSSGTLLGRPLILSNLDSKSSGNTNGVYFQPSAVNLAAYKGQTIRLVFHVKTDQTLPTTFRIDDISLTTQ
jgi:uncharacterized membrane protein